MRPEAIADHTVHRAPHSRMLYHLVLPVLSCSVLYVPSYLSLHALLCFLSSLPFSLSILCCVDILGSVVFCCQHRCPICMFCMWHILLQVPLCNLCATCVKYFYALPVVRSVSCTLYCHLGILSILYGQFILKSSNTQYTF